MCFCITFTIELIYILFYFYLYSNFKTIDLFGMFSKTVIKNSEFRETQYLLRCVDCSTKTNKTLNNMNKKIKKNKLN